MLTSPIISPPTVLSRKLPVPPLIETIGLRSSCPVAVKLLIDVHIMVSSVLSSLFAPTKFPVSAAVKNPEAAKLVAKSLVSVKVVIMPPSCWVVTTLPKL